MKNYRNYKKLEVEYEDKIAKKYNQLYHGTPISDAYDQDFVNFIKKNLKPGFKVLDLGCGAAGLWPLLLKIPQVKFVGADVSPGMIREAKKLFPKEKFIVADAEKTPFDNEEFDVIICSSILHHLPTPQKSFKEIRRILKPYGILMGREPQNDQFINETDPWIAGAITSLMHLVNRKEKFLKTNEPPIHEFHHAYKLTDFINKDLGQYFVVKDLVSKYPFSHIFAKTKNAFYGRIILKTDQFLSSYKGNQFYYTAIKDGYGKTEVLSYINTYLNNLDKNSKKVPLRFIKRLIWLTAFFDLILPRK